MTYSEFVVTNAVGLVLLFEPDKIGSGLLASFATAHNLFRREVGEISSTGHVVDLSFNAGKLCFQDVVSLLESQCDLIAVSGK